MGDQADHRSRSPALNRVEVGVEIPLPGPGYCVAIDPTGALREADPAPAVAQGHRRDAEWVALAGSCRRHGLYSLTGLCSAKKKIGQKQPNIVGLERAINAGSIYCGAQGNSKRSKQAADE